MSTKPTSDNDWLALYNQQAWSQIKDSYESCVSVDAQSVNPSSALFYIIALFHLGLYSDAVLASRSSYSLLKHIPEFFATWGAAARRNGDLDSSKDIFEEAIELFPDDSVLANNFANLLIDTNNFAEARTILQKALEGNPANSSDITVNLSRLDRLEEAKSPISSHEVSLHGTTCSLPIAIDPLLYAFTKQEVDHHESKQVKESSSKPNFSSQEIQERLKLARALSQTDPVASLKDIQSIYLITGCNYSLYTIASDAYIALKMFKEAEICALTSLALGANDPSLFINLSNFAHMRNEYRLANAYIDLAIKAGADKSVVKTVKERQGNPDLALDRIAPFLSDSPALL